MDLLIGKTFNFKRMPRARPATQAVVSKAIAPTPDSRTISGYAAVFGNVDCHDDILMPGAFAKAVQDFNTGKSQCRFLWSHDFRSPPIAQILEIKEVSRANLPAEMRAFPEVTGALLITRKYFTDDFSERVYQGVVSMATTEMSFGFDIIEFEYAIVNDVKVKRVKKVELLDASDVLWGANPYTMGNVKGPTILTEDKINQIKRHKLQAADLKRRLQQLKFSADHPEYDGSKDPKSMADYENFFANGRRFLRELEARRRA